MHVAPLTRHPGFMAVILMLGTVLASCSPTASGIHRTGRLYVPAEREWSGQSFRARLLGAEELYHRDYHYFGQHQLHIHLELEHLGNGLRIFNCSTNDQNMRSEFITMMRDTGLSRAKPEEKAQINYEKFQSTVGLLRLELGMDDLAQSDFMVETHLKDGIWLGRCRFGYAPAGPGTLPHEGPALWLWPERKTRARITCAVPDGSYPLRLSYGSEWEIRFDRRVRYSQDNNDLLEGLDFQYQLPHNFQGRTP